MSESVKIITVNIIIFVAVISVHVRVPRRFLTRALVFNRCRPPGERIALLTFNFEFFAVGCSQLDLKYKPN